jgi:hypothetical protein
MRGAYILVQDPMPVRGYHDQFFFRRTQSSVDKISALRVDDGVVGTLEQNYRALDLWQVLFEVSDEAVELV